MYEMRGPGAIRREPMVGAGRAARAPEVSRLQLRRHARPSAVTMMRTAVRGFLGPLGVSDARSADIQLAVTEACANVVRHAYPGGRGDVLCECEATEDEIVISVVDWGRGGDRPSTQPGLGLGMLVIERLSDHVRYTRSGSGTLVEMRFDRPPRLAVPTGPRSGAGWATPGGRQGSHLDR
jgi:anti-sigma regulatory factor (Ser/Thr protein kinase)